MDPATVKHVSMFKAYVSDRCDNKSMAKLNLYATHRQKNCPSGETPVKPNQDACQRCGSDFRFNIRLVRVPGHDGNKLKFKKSCSICGSKQVLKTDKKQKKAIDSHIAPQTPVTRTPQLIAQTPATSSTPVAANLQKLLTAKKRKSLNEGTGLLNFLVKSTSK
jgi:hypothetical protein